LRGKDWFCIGVEGGSIVDGNGGIKDDDDEEGAGVDCKGGDSEF